MTQTDSAAAPLRLALRYDLRSPPFGAPTAALYAAALDQAAWADGLGFASVWLSEHHCSDDGYCPSPLVMAAAVAGRTSRVRISLMALVLPLYEPLRLAEDLAVLDVASGGRLDVVVGAGYRPTELTMYGRRLDDRVPLVEDGIQVLRAAWSGAPFEHHGRTVQVLPTPLQPGGPKLELAGSTKGAARRAARLADGFHPVDPSLWPLYAAECERLGHEPGGSPPGSSGPLFLHVATDPDRVWPRIAPHALHEMNSYGSWLAEADGAKPFRPVTDADELRASGIYAVVTPDECIELVRSVDAITLHPLMGGLPVDLAWESLELFADQVLPAVRDRLPVTSDTS